MDKRRQPRAGIVGQATIQGRSGTITCDMLDVGLGGMAVVAQGDPPPGFVRVQFRVGPESAAFEVDGRVVRNVQKDGTGVWGVQFVGMDVGTKKRLRGYVAETIRDEPEATSSAG